MGLQSVCLVPPAVACSLVKNAWAAARLVAILAGLAIVTSPDACGDWSA